ncbi:MAG: transglycosylase domain-containing protein [Bifidobacteriaceae bacterium]|nr:transglycosylase domain-containing protein [Bifidobacteriaceae bacterium]
MSAKAQGVKPPAPADFVPGGNNAGPRFPKAPTQTALSAAASGGKGKRAPGTPKRYTRRGKPRYGFFNYPRKQYTGFHRWVPSWRFLWWSFVFGVGLVVGAFVLAYQMIDLPKPADFAQAQTSNVYYSDGVTPMGKFEVQNREIIDVRDLPQSARDAVVAAEDRTFWENVGVDPLALTRAFYNNLKGGKRQGGSTITQQYIERYWVGQTTTSLTGKFEEAMMALKVTREKDKMEILGDYMNTIYFGRRTWGIQTAAKAYFGKDAVDLTTAESALLAGLIPAPNAYDPEIDLEAATGRWNYVLDGMVKTGSLSQAERNKLEFPAFIPYEVPETFAGAQGYLLEMVRQELTTRGGLTDEMVGSAGLKIVTTVDKATQDEVAAAVADQLPDDADAGLHVAVASVEPGTGAIRMIYAGDDYLVRQQNAATDDVAQAGSTFKPITLAAALEQGISLDETFSGKSPLKIEDWTVRNSGNSQYGRITLLRATQSSVNTVYAQLNEQVGGETTRETAITAGIPTTAMGLDSDLTNVLGTASVHALDMARVYATFAAQGLRNETYIVESAISPDGKEVYSGRNDPVRVFSEDAMAELTYALTRVVEAGTGTSAKALDRPAAGKTGTSEENKSAWFCGYTPQLATAVAFYQQDAEGNPVPLTPFGQNAVIQGGGPPAKMWVAIMKVGLAGTEAEEFPPRPKDRNKPTGRSGGDQPAPSSQAPPSDKPPPEASQEPSQKPNSEPSTQPSAPATTTPTEGPSPPPGPTASVPPPSTGAGAGP